MERGGLLVYALVLSAAAAGALCAAGSPLKIAAFNVKVFGRTKLSRPEVVGVLKQIVRRYDIVLIQEVRDISEMTIPQFTAVVNNETSERYGAEVSERLGRTSSKEQYAFLYRTGVVEVVGTYQHNDTGDEFEREPFSVLFRARDGGEEFFLLGIHVKPSDVEGELESLVPAFQLASLSHGSSRGVILGDLNAGCSYLSRTAYERLSLVTDPAFVWLLGYDSDTTVASSSCPYDRFIIHEALNSSVVKGSATVFNFTEAYSLTAQQAENVSDHFPIEFQLQFQSQSSIENTATNPTDHTTTSTESSSATHYFSLSLLTAGLAVGLVFVN
jgi:endonuclease/exonuclease/phosphatase family metal-dependent hydrolase